MRRREGKLEAKSQARCSTHGEEPRLSVERAFNLFHCGSPQGCLGTAMREREDTTLTISRRFVAFRSDLVMLNRIGTEVNYFSLESFKLFTTRVGVSMQQHGTLFKPFVSSIQSKLMNEAMHESIVRSKVNNGYHVSME